MALLKRSTCALRLGLLGGKRSSLIPSFVDFYRQIAPALGCRDDSPQPPKQMFGKWGWSQLEAQAKSAEACLIHLESHHLFNDRGFKDGAFAELFAAVARITPQMRFLLESRIQPPAGCLPKTLYFGQRLDGLAQEAMVACFALKGWQLTPALAADIFKALGGKHKKDGALPLVIVLYCALAENYGGAAAVWHKFREQLHTDVEQVLFNDLYCARRKGICCACAPSTARIFPTNTQTV